MKCPSQTKHERAGVIGETVGDGLVSVRLIAMGCGDWNATRNELTENELPNQHCGGAATSPGTGSRKGETNVPFEKNGLSQNGSRERPCHQWR